MRSESLRCALAVSVLTVALPLLLSVQMLAAQGPQVKRVDPRSNTAQMLRDPATSAWQLFVFVNYPELPGNRGVPDIKRFIGDKGPTVWESYKNVSEVYRPNGVRPAPWEVNDELPPNPVQAFHPTAQQLAAVGAVDSNWIHFLSEPVMIDGQQVCDSDSQIVHYDVRGDRSYFDYVAHNPSGHQLYNIQGQLAALADANFAFQFPSDAIEVKASWKMLPPGADTSRYWTAIGVYYNHNHVLQVARIGLTGLHIISKALPNWFWSTFEQVDNPTKIYKWVNYKNQKGDPVGVNPNFNSAVAPVNQQWQQALAGTKWQYYALMDTQTEFVNASQQPILSSNTQMETYFQPNSSCISCHKLASVGPKENLRLQLFYPVLPYTGNVDFKAVANQQYPGQVFKDMDFVWSLRNAQYKKPVPAPAK